MKKVLACVTVAAVAVAVLSAFSAVSVEARPPYNKAFGDKYVKEGTAIHKTLGGSSNCNVCHVGKDKKKRNDYGAALGKLLKDEKDAEKINKALDDVAKQNSKADDKKSPTFGELIEKGTLPITKDD